MGFRLVFPYSVGGSPLRMVVIDTESGDGVSLDATEGGIFPKTCVPLGGKLYFNSGNHLNVHDTADDSITTLGQVADSTLYSGYAAPDGRLFFGTFSEGRLIEYDPQTDTLTDHGRMDADGPTQYAYSIAADDQFAYVGLGQSPWYLGVYNRSSGEKTLYYKSAGFNGNVEVGVDNSIWWANKKLVNGVPEDGHSKPAVVPWYWAAGSNWEITTWADEIGYEVNLDDAIPFGDTPPTIRWRAVGAEAWQEYQPDGVPLRAEVIHRLYRWDVTRLLCISQAYGSVFLYNVHDKSIELLGFPQVSLYDAAKLGDDWYFSGYAAATLRYDPQQAWTLTRSSGSAGTNPYLALVVNKYHTYSAAGSDGRLYVAADHERDSVGGELGWYDPQTQATGTLRDPLARWSPRGLAAVGAHVVYSGLSLDSEPGALFVLTTSDPTAVERTITPLPEQSYTSAGCIVSVSGTDVVGVVGTHAYRVNVTTGALVWAVELPGQSMSGIASINRRLELAPDGWLYFYVDTAIYKLNPASGAVVKVIDDSLPSPIMWHEGVAYLYGRTNLRRLKL